MQGPSELGISADASLAHWDRTEDWPRSTCPPWSSARSTTPWTRPYMEMMAGRLPQGRYLHCPDGSHMAMYDDQAVYFAGLIDFLHGLEG